MFLLWNKLKASVYLLRLIKIKWLKCLSSLGNNFLLRVCSLESRRIKFHVKQAQSHPSYHSSADWTPYTSIFVPEIGQEEWKEGRLFSVCEFCFPEGAFRITLQRHEQNIQNLLVASSWNHVSELLVKKLCFQEQLLRISHVIIPASSF